jgi:hypothetical protein
MLERGYPSFEQNEIDKRIGHLSHAKIMGKAASQAWLLLPREYLTNKSEAQAKALSCIVARPLQEK